MNWKDVLEDQVSIVTGASGGIGKACAKLLLQQKSRVVLVDVNQAGLAETVEELKQIGDSSHILSLPLNVTSEIDMEAMVSKTVNQFSRIDNLVAAAGILRLGNQLKQVVETPLDEWNKILQVNLTGTFLSNRAVLPVMQAQKWGNIINISSVSGKQGRAFDAAYCASKFGIVGLSESLAEEVGPQGIRVQTLLPDAVDTPLWDQNPRGFKSAIALPPERVAEFILYLLALPRDTFLLNPTIAPMRPRKKRKAGVAEAQ